MLAADNMRANDSAVARTIGARERTIIIASRVADRMVQLGNGETYE
jgi:hypothetical protein